MTLSTPRRRKPAPRPQQILLGPLLHARGAGGATGSASRWRVAVSVLLAGDGEPPDLAVDGVSLPVPPRFLHEWDGLPAVGPAAHGLPPTSAIPERLRLWRYDFAVPRGLQDGRTGYGFQNEERRWHFTVPGTAMPPRIAYAACGGCEDEGEITRAGLSRNALWGQLLGRHRTDPFHLLLMGGDQIYADGLWDAVPALREAGALPLMKRTQIRPAPDLTTQLDAWYLAVYRHAWNQPETAALLAGVPGLRIWDDHDIIDGWGSHPDALLQSPLYQTLYAAARQAYRLFQIAMAADDPPETLLAAEPPGFTQGMMDNGIGILAPDLRSERQPDQVLAPRSLRALPGWLERFSTCSHLLVMSSVPLIFPSFGLVERMLNLLPGRQKMEDDLRDQWRSPAHAAEWQEIVATLGAFARDRRCTVTILSGEVHLGARGAIQGPGFTLRQCVSSGIVHPAPDGLAVDMMERLAARPERIGPDLTLTMAPMPGLEKRLLRCRNWLSLTGDDQGDIRAAWHAEGMEAPLEWVIPGGGA